MAMQPKFNWTEEITALEELVKSGIGIYAACKQRGYSYTALSNHTTKEQRKDIKALKKQPKTVQVAEPEAA